MQQIPIKIGIIGGTGFSNLNLMDDYKELEVVTKYGEPSGPLFIGKVRGREVVILKRHGRKHMIMPSMINYRANVWALKQQGCTHIISSAAGRSLKDEIHPGHLILPDQFIDQTSARRSTFYDEDAVCHINMTEPFCGKLRNIFAEALKMLHYKFHENKTVLVFEGPRFSTRAEANYFRQVGADVVNMTIAQEAVLAKEAGICYQPIVIATGFTSWESEKRAPTVEEIQSLLRTNSEKGEKIFTEVISKIDFLDCDCRGAIECAIIK